MRTVVYPTRTFWENVLAAKNFGRGRSTLRRAGLCVVVSKSAHFKRHELSEEQNCPLGCSKSDPRCRQSFCTVRYFVKAARRTRPTTKVCFEKVCCPICTPLREDTTQYCGCTSNDKKKRCEGLGWVMYAPPLTSTVKHPYLRQRQLILTQTLWPGYPYHENTAWSKSWHPLTRQFQALTSQTPKSVNSFKSWLVRLPYHCPTPNETEICTGINLPNLSLRPMRGGCFVFIARWSSPCSIPTAVRGSQ